MILRKYLVDNRITIAHLARLIGVSRGYLSQVTIGNMMPSKRLCRLIEIETGGAVKWEDFQGSQEYFDIHREGNNVVIR